MNYYGPIARHNFKRSMAKKVAHHGVPALVSQANGGERMLQWPTEQP